MLHRGSRWRRRRYHIAPGRRVYSDLMDEGKPLFSHKLQLAGCPDYIVRSDGRLVPVEVKSRTVSQPYQSHVLQLACYCQLVEDAYHQFVSHGLLVYENDRFRIGFDPKLRFELEGVLRQMRQVMRSGKVSVSHQDPNRCLNCSMKQHCSVKLI